MVELKVKLYNMKTGHSIVCYADPLTLKRKRRKFRNKNEAKAFKKELELKFSTHGKAIFNQTPVSQLLKLHLEQNPDSRILERKNHFLSFCDEFGHLPINHVNRVNLSTWFKKIKETDDLSDRTLLTIRSNLNAFFKYLEDKEVISESPLKKIKFDRKPPPRRQRVVLSVNEVNSIIQNAKLFSPCLLYPFLFTVAYTGARRSEILKLKKSDIDLDMGLIHLRNTKNGEDRSIIIPESLKVFLKEFLSSHQSSWAFPDQEGNQIGRQRLTRALTRLKKHFPTGKNWGPHALRHSYAYNFLRQGGQMYELQAILGHKSIDVTVDTYGQIGAQDVKSPCPYEANSNLNP